MAIKDELPLDLSPQDAGIYNFMGPVDHESIKPVIDWILVENHVRKPRKKELVLMVNSEGEDMAAAFALNDVMIGADIPVKTVGLGLIASAGLMIFIAGHPGKRVLTPNTSILSHQFSWYSEGKEHELFAVIKEFELTQARMINHYKVCTNLGDEDIKKYLLPPQDVWLGATEAQRLGICDSITEVAKRRTK